MSALFERITIIGLGLIGSSIARACREYKLADIIVGCDTNQTSLTYARSHEFIDSPVHNPHTAVSQSQMVILATPPSAFEAVTRNMAPNLKPGVIVMDTASVKRMAMQAIGAHLPTHVDFIPAHPIAGSERSGISAGSADLFQKKRVIVTPNEPLQSGALQTITSFWKGMGARVEGMPAEMHDTIYAYVSHLPQLLAYAAHHVTGNSPALEQFLRLSHSNPDLWSELFYLNQDNIIIALDRYLDAINHVTHELQQAPVDTESKSDEAVARTVLFPRIAASCLITTVMEAEKKAGVPFARFAGTGFADFTSPASQPPDGDIESISQHHRMVIRALGQFSEKLQAFRSALASGDIKAMQEALPASSKWVG